MCLSIPYKVRSIKNNQAVVISGKKQKKVRLDLVKNLKKGDYLISQNNFAVRKISKKNAEEILKLIGD